MKNDNSFFNLMCGIVAIIFGVWAFCFPISEFAANHLFDCYMEEYNIPEDDIASRRIIKTFTFREPVVMVEYKSDPLYKYEYHYELGNFFDIHPDFVIIYSGRHKNISIGRENHHRVKYPPVTQ